MSVSDHPLRSEFLQAVGLFNEGSLADAAAHFSADATFIAPGNSAVAGTYRGREGVARFFERLQRLGGDGFTVTPVEVLANDDHLVLFLRFSGGRGADKLDVTVAGFHSDHGADGWRRCTFLPDDMASFDRFFTSV